jgi:spore maturation protein CgeB
MTAPDPAASALRILMVGELDALLTTGARLAAFRELGVAVEGVDSRAFLATRSSLLRRLTHLTLRTPGVYAFNREIVAAAERFRPNVLWLEKPVFVFPGTLRRLRRMPGLRLVYHNTDDWRAKDRFHAIHWRYLLSELPRYQLYVLSNLHNVREFREQGLGPVHHMELAANPGIRDPAPIDDEERRRLGGPVGFIGHWEPVTEHLLAHVAAAGIPVKIYGGSWDDADAQGPLGDGIQHRLVWGEEYARAICCFDVNVGIVSKWNRNHTASRTFQIPALGGFLLHERNELVTSYFREGEEAEFFGSAEELLEKCRHYLAHPEERLRVAKAGRRRCLESGYFEVDRVREVLPRLLELVREA